LYLPEHEWHEIGLLIYHYHLRSKGMNSIYLGQSLPYDALLKTIELLKPGALISCWLTAIEQEEIITYLEQLKKDIQPVTIAVSGYQTDQLKHKLPSGIRHIQALEDLDQLK
jgi:methanogenic corrinoid protein MtbC1